MALGLNEFIIVGNGGNIFKRDVLGSWSALSSPTSNNLTYIWGANQQNLFLGGTGVIFSSLDGGDTWNDLSSVAGILGGESVVQINGIDENDVYFSIAGLGVKILRYNNGSWSNISPPAGGNPGGIWAFSSTNIWTVQTIAGDDEIKQYNGSSWSVQGNGSVGRFLGIGENELYLSSTSDATIINQRLYLWDGISWSLLDELNTGGSGRNIIAGIDLNSIIVATNDGTNRFLGIKYNGSLSVDYTSSAINTTPVGAYALDAYHYLFVCENGNAFFMMGLIGLMKIAL